MNGNVMENTPHIGPKIYERITACAYDHCGVDLRRGKEQLVSVRLGKKMRELGCASFESYFSLVEQDRTGEALTEMIDALTTNYTSFLREAAHFAFMKQEVLPKLKDRDRIQIWSAASSTGEEIFSILFTLLDHYSLPPESLEAARKLKVRGTDISSRALRVAQAGVYAEDRLEELPAGWLRRYFLRGNGRQEGQCRVKPEIRKLAEFNRFNLIEPDGGSQQYPLIFCRNAMIYFDRQTQEKVVRTLADRLEPGGYLFIGHSESLNGISHSLTYIKPAVFRKSGGGRGGNKSILPKWGAS